MKITKKHWSVVLTLLITTSIMLIIIFNWPKLAALLKILLFSIIFSYILIPVCDLLERRMSRLNAIIVIFVLILTFFGVFIFFFIPTFVQEAVVLAERFPKLINALRGFLNRVQKNMESAGIPIGIRNSIVTYADTLQIKVTNIVMSFLERLVTAAANLPSLLIVPVLGFYFLKDREYFARFIMNILPLKPRRDILKMAAEINHILHQFVRGEVFIASVIALLCTVGYWLIGLPYALVLGFVAGIFEFIPYFGPWLGAIPALIIAFISGSDKLIWTIVVSVLIQQLESIFITPRILGGVVMLHPVYIILSLWAGGLFFGVAGMFFAVPAVLILRVIIKHIYLGIVSSK